MYNRYIPQQDGTHKRKTIPDRPRECAQRPQSPTPPPVQDCPPVPPPPPRTKPCQPRTFGDAGSFLKNLLPRDFDTGDLIILLLLLLMAGDCQEDQNWAWLTLALYLFL